MTGTAKGSAALYAEINANLGPNSAGTITAAALDTVLSDIVASSPNTVDGGSSSTTPGTITAGLWNGTPIALAYGGTGASLAPSAGGLLYSGSSALAVLAGTATADQALLSGANAAPSWSTTAYPVSTTVNQLLYSPAPNVISGLATANGGILNASASGVPSITATPTLGVPGSVQGSLTIAGVTSGTVAIGVQANAGTATVFNLPATNGTANQLAQTDGNGNVTWSTAVWPATTTVNQILWSSSANTIAGLTTGNNGVLNTSGSGVPSITPTPVLGSSGAAGGSISLRGLTSGSSTIQVPAIAGTATNFTLPNSNGTSGFFLQTDGSGNSSWQSITATITQPITPQGRLTLTTGVPVMTGTVSAAGTVFYTPYVGATVPLWGGSTFTATTCSQLSNVLANSATGNAGPAAGASSSFYDLFVWSNSGTPTLTRGPAWTNGTTRSAGTAISRVQGILTNNVAITNGPGIGAGTYVGTVATDSGGATVTWSPVVSGSGGAACVLNVWNMYNRVVIGASVEDTGATYTYTTGTVREARGSTNNRITTVTGQQEDSVTANLNVAITFAASATAFPGCGIGLNSTTSFATICLISNQGSTAASASLYNSFVSQLSIGANSIYSLEEGDGTNANTFNELSTNTLSISYRM